MVRVDRIDSGLLHSNMYVVQENGHAIVIDPCLDTTYAENLQIDYLMITHEHYDHISGVNAWKKVTNAPLICSKSCSVSIRNPKKNMSRYFDVFCQMQTWMPIDGMDIQSVDYQCEADVTFEDSYELSWQGHGIRLLEVPGHSEGSISIQLNDTDIFTGDSLLRGQEIELRFPGGNAKKWEEIGRQRIESIPDGMRIWPGHFEGFIMRKNVQDN